jgi:hypothetical protein
MSIFKDTFIPEIQQQLNVRQEAISQRTPQAIQYFNARNAWIRMTSAVEVNDDAGALAKQYVLLGGTLNDNKNLRAGVGIIENAYSIFSPSGNLYGYTDGKPSTAGAAGIRPMPGITSIEVKSKSAYGSLREVVVNFNCWNIQQLEDLELLYMRPGYTVLIEWGWLPYLDNKSVLQPNVSFYNGVLESLNNKPSKEQVWKDLFNKTKEHSGNYDAMFGYVKNYSWSARMDGGYDCTTTIITLGEILESLKVNYTAYDNPTVTTQGVGLAKSLGVSLDQDKLSDAYSKNILAGLFYEMYEIGKEKTKSNKDEGKGYVIKDTKYNNYYDLFHKTINIKGGENEATSNGEIGASDEQIYISLEGLVNLFNNYVILQDGANKTSLIKLSVHERQYDNPKPINPITGEGYLKALAHPLQISVDPTVCIIKNDLWSNGGIKFNVSSSNADPNTGAPVIRYSNTDYTDTIKKVNDELDKSNSDEQKIIETILSSTKRNTNEFKELQRQYLLSKNKKFNNVYEWLDSELSTEGLNLILYGKESFNATKEEQTLGDINKAAITLTNAEVDAKQLERTKNQLNDSSADLVKTLGFLKNLQRPYFVNNDYLTEVGIIGNIFVNLSMLYNLAVDENLQSQDKKEKNDIVLYNYMKSVLSKISYAIGNVNNFDLHVDPIDNNIVRIIDINLVDLQEQQKIYDDSFELQVHNTKSTVRNYNLQSQMFPEMSSIVSISAQVQGGALGTDTTTLVDFNKNVKDRIIPVKISALNDSSYNTSNNVLSVLTQSLNTLYKYFSQLNYNLFTYADFNADKANDYKNALKDLINTLKAISYSKTNNKAIIPTTLSLVLDGIGGLVIGHIFKLPPDLLPRGYRGSEVGSKLGYVVTRIGHDIKKNDWTTKIEAQTIILDNPRGPKIDYPNVNLEINPQKNTTAIKGNGEIPKGITNSGAGYVAEDSTKYPILLKYYSWKNSYSSTVQKFAKVSEGKTPVADSLRAALDKNYITEKGSELSSNGDITEDLKAAILKFQDKIKSNRTGFNFINGNKPIVITGGNDTFHRTYDGGCNKTTHCRGLAIDLSATNFNGTQLQSIMTALQESGFTFVIAHGGTAFHIHANIKTT